MEDENHDHRVYPQSRGRGGHQFHSRGRGSHPFQSRGGGGHQFQSMGWGSHQFHSRGGGSPQFQGRGGGGPQFQGRGGRGHQFQRMDQNGRHSRFPYGIHFSNAPSDIEVDDIHQVFGGFGQFEVLMKPGDQHGWVGFHTMESCNAAYAQMRQNLLGMSLRRGAYETGPIRQPVMGDDERYIDRVIRPVSGPLLLASNYHNHPDYVGGPPYYLNEDPDIEQGPCTYCLTITKVSCGRCAAFYCSEMCQRSDWSRHRDECDSDIPPLNIGPRYRSGAGDKFQDVGERVHRRPVNSSSGGLEDADRPRSGRSNPEERSPSDHRSYDGDHRSGRSEQERRQGGYRRNEERPPDVSFSHSQNQRPDGAVDRRSNDGWVDNGSRSSDDRPSSRFPPRNDRRPDNDQLRLNNGFPRRNEKSERSGNNDRHSTVDQRVGNGFNDSRKHGDHHSMKDQSEENGFSPGFGDDDRREGSYRREGNNRHLMKNKPNENGFSRRFGDGDRSGYSDRHPMGGRRDETGFNDRRVEGDRRGGHDRQRSAEHRIENRLSDRRTAGNENNTSAGHSFVSQINKTEAFPAEREVCINMKNNDRVVIANIKSFDCVHLTPPMSSYSEEFRRISKLLASHCESAPALERAPSADQLVACQFVVDRVYYRAVVKRVLSEGEYVVQFVDYGNTQKCKLSDLKAIPDELKRCPRNAVQVSLRGLDAVRLSGEIADFIVNLDVGPVELSVQFDGDISKGVELFLPNGESVNKKVLSLVKSEEKVSPISQEISSLLKRDTPASKPPDAPVSQEVPSLLKRNTSASKPLDAPVSKENASLPEKSIPATTSPADEEQGGRKQFLSSILKKIDQPGHSDSLPAEEGVCAQLKNNDLVVIQYCENTDSTYISPGDIFADHEVFMNLCLEVESHCRAAPVLGRQPRNKEVVGCLDSHNVFYRAVVSEVLPDGVYKMFYIDFGNEETCGADRLREIPDSFKILPRQAVKIRFRGVDIFPNKDDVQKLLLPLIEDVAKLKLQFDGSIENGVELIKLDGRSLNEELRSLRRQESEPETEEDLKPPPSLPLPTEKPFDLLVFSVVEDQVVAACCAEDPKIEQFVENYVPKIRDYCDARPSEEHRPKVGQMCLAKSKEGWARALTLAVNDDDTREVFLVDDGNSCDVKPKDIRKIPTDIRSHPLLLTLCRVVVRGGAVDSDEAWATIKSRIDRDIERDQYAELKNVTSEMSDGLRTVFITL